MLVTHARAAAIRARRVAPKRSEQPQPVNGDNDVATRQMITGLVVAVIAVLLLSACGVTRNDENRGLHRLRMMVPNSPGSGYDLTARTAVKIMEDNGITGRFEVLNVIGAGGTVGMARLMNEKGNDDLMMMMGLGVVGATYTNGSKAGCRMRRRWPRWSRSRKAFSSQPIRRSRRCRIRRGVEGRSGQGDDRRRVVAGRAGPSISNGNGQGRRCGPGEVNFVSYDGGGDLLTALLGKKITAGTSGLGRIARPDRIRPVAGARGVRQ